MRAQALATRLADRDLAAIYATEFKHRPDRGADSDRTRHRDHALSRRTTRPPSSPQLKAAHPHGNALDRRPQQYRARHRRRPLRLRRRADA